MELTTHAKTRMQQRSISPIVIDLLVRFGHSEPAGNGTRKYYLDKLSRQRLHKYAGALSGAIEQHLDVFVIVGDDNSVITAAHRCKRIRRQ